MDETGPGIVTPQRVAAGVFVLVVLLAAADFEPTSSLAVAFAWVIFFSTLFTVGPSAFANVQTMIGE
jgi:hypothetical protein